MPVTFTANCGNSTCTQPSFTVTYFQLPFTPLGRTTQQNSTRANFVTEVLAPRVARFGVRLNF